MGFKALGIGAILLLGIVGPAAAQSPAPAANSASGSDGVVAVVDVSRLPIDLRRIERRFRQTTFREERDGLNLRYFVDVYAKAPDIVLLTPADNLFYGPVPYGAPTHREMIEMVTPKEYRAPAANFGNLLRWLADKKGEPDR
jgi:hypothetical protein